MLPLLGPRAAALSLYLTWLVFCVACLVWGRRTAGAFPLRGTGCPFPFLLSAMALSPAGLVAGWWLLRSEEWPAVGYLTVAYSCVGALVSVLGMAVML
ncbi:MAG: hypothetical protein Q8S33_11140 [Myxococcales bacterium]|nr:hypothetical protein [Myxococcales bacterium]MDP3500883.1 hypothetical protein [Myxococcales bacterium]